MKFEDFLQEHKDEFGFDRTHRNLWSDIEAKTTGRPPKIVDNRWLWITVLLGLFVCLLMITVVMLSTQRTQDVAIETEALRNEISEIKGLLEARTVSNKIRGIQKASFIQESQRDQLTQTLLEIIDKDEHLNVRYAALRSLQPYKNQEDVKVRLIKIMTNTENDHLRIRLISFLSQDPDIEMETYLENLLREQPANQVLRQEAEDALQQVRKI